MRKRYGKLPFCKTSYGRRARAKNALSVARMAMSMAVGQSVISTQICSSIGAPGKQLAIAHSVVNAIACIAAESKNIDRFANG